MENSIEQLEKELKAKERLFDEKYVQNNANDYLSEEAEKMRKEIWQLSRRIDQMKEKRIQENSIEEDIKIVEKLINTMKSDRTMFEEDKSKEIYTFFINSLEHILSDYKRVLKENEELNKKLILQKGIGDYWCEAYMELQKERERKK